LNEISRGNAQKIVCLLVTYSKSVVKTKGFTVEYKHLALRKLKSIQKKDFSWYRIKFCWVNSTDRWNISTVVNYAVPKQLQRSRKWKIAILALTLSILISVISP